MGKKSLRRKQRNHQTEAVREPVGACRGVREEGEDAEGVKDPEQRQRTRRRAVCCQTMLGAGAWEMMGSTKPTETESKETLHRDKQVKMRSLGEWGAPTQYNQCL